MIAKLKLMIKLSDNITDEVEQVVELTESDCGADDFKMAVCDVFGNNLMNIIERMFNRMAKKIEDAASAKDTKVEVLPPVTSVGTTPTEAQVVPDIIDTKPDSNDTEKQIKPSVDIDQPASTGL